MNNDKAREVWVHVNSRHHITFRTEGGWTMPDHADSVLFREVIRQEDGDAAKIQEEIDKRAAELVLEWEWETPTHQH